MNTLNIAAQLLLTCYEVHSAKAEDLLEALQRGTLQKWSAETKICTEGEDSQNMYIILTGAIRVLKKDDAKGEREIAILIAPTMIGQMGLIEELPRSATCMTMGEVQAISIDVPLFYDILRTASKSSSAFRHLLLASMSIQLFTANAKIRKLIAEMELAQRAEQDTQEEPHTLPSKRADIANTLDGWNHKENNRIDHPKT